MINQIQHGDVLIQRVGSIPQGAAKRPRNGKLVVMAGETTGHAHVITEKTCDIWELKGDIYLDVTEPVTITHEEHKPIDIPEGVYKIGRVQEYDYYEAQSRLVQD